MAAVFSLPPNELGYCGPEVRPGKTSLISKFLTGRPTDVKQIIELLSQFVVATAFYELIAVSNQLSNFFDSKVIEAYWIGNELLNNVPVEATRIMFHNKFAPINSLLGQNLERRIPQGSHPHHSLHVLSAGPVNPNLTVSHTFMDNCLVKPGVVVNLTEGKATVTSRTLEKNRGKLLFKKSTTRSIKWNPCLLPHLKVGDRIASHWATACLLISEKQADQLLQFTLSNLEAINSTGS